MCFIQGLANGGPRVKSGPLPVFLNKFLLDQSVPPETKGVQVVAQVVAEVPCVCRDESSICGGN